MRRSTGVLYGFCVALALALPLLGQEPLGSLPCPAGTVQNFRVTEQGCPSGSLVLQWDNADVTDYEILAGTAYPSYCSVSSFSLNVVAKTAGTAFQTSVPLNQVFLLAVRATGCAASRSTITVVDTLTSPATAPVVNARVTGAGQITVDMQQPGSDTFALYRLERSVNGGSFVTLNVDSLDGSFQNYCATHSVASFVDSGLRDGVYTYRLSNTGNAATCFQPVSATTSPVTLGCPAPAAPTLGTPASIPSGKPLAFSWTVPSALLDGGSYVLETSTDGFKTFQTTTSVTPSAVIATNASGSDVTLAARVRAVQACGVTGGYSNVVNVRLTATPATFVRKNAGPAWSAPAGSDAQTAFVTFKNVGGQPGTLFLSPSASFFSVFPTNTVVNPGAEVQVKLTAPKDQVAYEGYQAGTLSAEWGNGVIITPVSLRVVPNGVSGAKARANVATVLFSAPAGQTPASQQITINVAGGKSGVPVALVPSVGPGGSWLQLGNEIGGQLPSNGSMTLTLSVRRSRRSYEDGSNLVRTVLMLTPYGGDPVADAAVIEVLDLDTLSPSAAAGLRGSAPNGGSFVLPTAVRQTSGVDASQVFTSDGWLRNLSGSPVTADLYCTVDGKDGLTSTAGLAHTLVSLPAFGIFRTSDLMRTVFGANGVSANIEVRSANIAALTYRSTTDSVKGGDPGSRFGTEIPAVSFGSGVGLGDPELMVPGIDSDARNRSNLILAETSGAAATAKITVNGADGTILRTLERVVPPLSKVQVNSSDLVPANTSGGSVGVLVTSGAGHVVPVATVIDNASGSFSAILGQAPRASVASASASRPAPLATVPRQYVMPTAVRTTGAFNTFYSTNMAMANITGASASLTFTYRYVDLDDGNKVKVATKTRVIPPRGSFPKDLGSDVIASFFGVTNRSYGSVYVEGDIGRVSGTMAVSTRVDPNDPTKGVKTSQVPGVFLDSPSIMPMGAQEHRFAGLEKSQQKRSNLVLLEVDGQPATVHVKLATSNGDPLGEQTFTVGANEYKQINDVFGGGGVNAGDGPFQDVEVTANVVSGTGRVLALASVIDNISFNPEVFILTAPAPPPDPTIGF